MFEFRIVRRVARLASLCCLIAASTVATNAQAAEPFRYAAAKQGPAELKLIEGLPVIIATGTPEEMGQQIGGSRPRRLQSLFAHQKDVARGFGLSQSGPLWTAAGSVMLPRFPANQRTELEAMAKASGMDADLMVFANVMYDWSRLGSCSAQMVEPARSATGGMLFGRDFDFPTFGFLDQYSLVVVYRAKDKHEFASVTFPGLVGCVSGINDAGLCLWPKMASEVNSSKDAAPGFDPAGVPIEMCFRCMMEECKTLDEAEKLLRSLKPSTMCNLAICDKESAAVLEITPRHIDSPPGCRKRFAHAPIISARRNWPRRPNAGATIGSKAFATGRSSDWTTWQSR